MANQPTFLPVENGFIPAAALVDGGKKPLSATVYDSEDTAKGAAERLITQVWAGPLCGAIIFKIWLARLVTPTEIPEHPGFFHIGTTLVAAFVAALGFLAAVVAATNNRRSSQ